MGRRLVPIVSVVSLMICLLTLALWAFSVTRFYPHFEWGNSRTGVARQGTIINGTIEFSRYWGVRDIDLEDGSMVAGRIEVGDGWDTAGFHFHSIEFRKFDSKAVAPPEQHTNSGWKMLPESYGRQNQFWFELIWPLILSLPLSLWLMWKLARELSRKWRRREGFCRKCGYDLRATPDRCPECGTAATKR